MVSQHLPAVLPLTLLGVRWVFLNDLEDMPKDYLDIVVLVRAVLDVRLVLAVGPLQDLLEKSFNLLLFLILLHFGDAGAGWLLLRRCKENELLQSVLLLWAEFVS